MYGCVYVCVHAYVCVYVGVLAYVCVRARMCVCVRGCVCGCTSEVFHVTVFNSNLKLLI